MKITIRAVALALFAGGLLSVTGSGFTPFGKVDSQAATCAVNWVNGACGKLVKAHGINDGH